MKIHSHQTHEAASATPKTARLSVERLESLLVVSASEHAMSDAEWERGLDAIRNDGGQTVTKILVWTEGSVPSAKQRKNLENAVRGRNLRVAVVSDSVATRFVGAMIALFVKNFRHFSLGELESAYEHLRLTPDERKGAQAILAEWKNEANRV